MTDVIDVVHEREILAIWGLSPSPEFLVSLRAVSPWSRVADLEPLARWWRIRKCHEWSRLRRKSELRKPYRLWARPGWLFHWWGAHRQR